MKTKKLVLEITLEEATDLGLVFGMALGQCLILREDEKHKRLSALSMRIWKVLSKEFKDEDVQ